MWSPDKIATLVTAVTALVTAVGGVIALFAHQRTQHGPTAGGK